MWSVDLSEKRERGKLIDVECLSKHEGHLRQQKTHLTTGQVMIRKLEDKRMVI